MMRRFFLTLVFLFLAISPLPASTDLTIDKVVDGETLLLSDGRRVRMIGINTTNVRAALSERYKLTPDQINRLPVGNVASDAMEYIRQHAVGKNIILSFDSANEKKAHTDSEGRVLAYVWYTTHSSAAMTSDEGGASQYLGVTSQDRLLNQELVMMGQALVDTSANFVQKQIFLDHEKDAAAAKKGFWRSASELYQDLLKNAQGSQNASTAGFVDEEARALSLKSARAAYEKLIQINPKDYRPYYERSWLGANAVHDAVSEDNLKDIDRAIELSPFQPKCFMQRFFIQRLLGQYDEALISYGKMAATASKLGMTSAVSELANAEIDKAEWKHLTSTPKKRLRALQAVRATLNEDHFLFWMARYKSYRNVPKYMYRLHDKISGMGRFSQFMSKHENFLASSEPHAILYQTQWGQSGLKTPEDIIKWMETVGEAPVSFEQPAK